MRAIAKPRCGRVDFPLAVQCFVPFVVRKNIRQLFAIEDTCGMKGTHYNGFTRQVICMAAQGMDIERHALKLFRLHRQVVKYLCADSLGGCAAEVPTNRARLAG